MFINLGFICLLLVHKKCLFLYSVTLLKSLLVLGVFFRFLGIFWVHIISSANTIYISLSDMYSLFLLTVLVRIFFTMSNKTDECGNILFLILGRLYSVFRHKYHVSSRFFIDVLYQIEEVPLFLNFS